MEELTHSNAEQNAIARQLAKHLHNVYHGGNWTVSNMKELLDDVNWQEATRQVHDFNTIATLVFHTGYFVGVLLMVLEGKPLDAHDKYSFAHPPILNQTDWDAFCATQFEQVKKTIQLLENLPDEQLTRPFSDPKYGTWFRNINGIIEHTHYHLGQIALIKKLVRASK